MFRYATSLPSPSSICMVQLIVYSEPVGMVVSAACQRLMEG
jgi:hypothetical protein